MEWTMTFTVRQLTAADAALFRDLRLEALQAAPTAFSSSYQEESSRTVGDYARIAETSRIFAVFADDVAVGLAALRVLEWRNVRHRGEIWGMYVRESHRGGGAAAALMDGLLAAAAALVSQVELNVVADNARAVAYYERHGFAEIGRIPTAARDGGNLIDEIMMFRRVGE
jgi:ribosomal protein S18 acetylase RimI-like enzyme